MTEILKAQDAGASGGRDLEGKVFVGCPECGLEWPEPGEERHVPTCSKIDWEAIWRDQDDD